MPTARPRYLLTQTDDLTIALDTARRRWPEDQERPTALLLHLIDEGRRSIDDERQRWIEARRHAIAHASDGLDGVYEDGYLEKLREDWPE